ncbi:MAG: hypothetical protein WA776_21190 [Xanthobacteraceae bacterium]
MPWIAGLTAAIITTSATIPAQAVPPYEITVLESTPGFFDLPLRNAVADFAHKLNLNVKIITVTGGGGLATEFEGGPGRIECEIAVPLPRPRDYHASRFIAGFDDLERRVWKALPVSRELGP